MNGQEKKKEEAVERGDGGVGEAAEGASQLTWKGVVGAAREREKAPLLVLVLVLAVAWAWVHRSSCRGSLGWGGKGGDECEGAERTVGDIEVQRCVHVQKGCTWMDLPRQLQRQRQRQRQRHCSPSPPPPPHPPSLTRPWSHHHHHRHRHPSHGPSCLPQHPRRRVQQQRHQHRSPTLLPLLLPRIAA